MTFVLISTLTLFLFTSCATKPQTQKEEAQEMESSLWVVNPVQKTCIHYPGGDIDELVSGLQQETGEVCQVSLADMPGESVRTILCGDMNTGKAWIVTEHEETCQDIIKAYEQYNHRGAPETLPEKNSTPQGEKGTQEVDAVYEV